MQPYRYFERTIAGGEVIKVNVYANFFILLSCDITTTPYISIGGASFEEFPAGLSIQIDNSLFKYVEIQNPSSSESMVLTFAFSQGIITNTNLTLSDSVFTTILDELRGSTTAPDYGRVQISSSTATETIASNSSRKAFSLYNPDTNTGAMYIGWDNTVSSTNYGIKLDPGESYARDDYRGDVYVIAEVNNEYIHYSE